MKYLPAALALVCAMLIVALFGIKRSDDAQLENSASAITDLSNQVASAQMRVATCVGTILTLSNRLDESRSASLAFSNQLMDAQTAIGRGAEQITNLNRQFAEAETETQTLGRRVMDLTNLMARMAGHAASLTNQIRLTQASLDQAYKDYALLENRLRRDVAERVVVERKFNNPSQLRAQIENLQWSPAREISADRFYAGLDVEVKSNAFHVISPK